MKKSREFRAKTQSRRGGRLALALVFCGVAAALAGCTDTASSPTSDRPSAVPEIGRIPPNFILPALEGDPVELHQVIGEKRMVLVNFWATWCGPCRIELPMLEKLYRKYKNDGFTVLAVSVDEDRQTVEEYVKSAGFTFPVLHDSARSVQSRYRIYAFPTSIVLDKQGKIQNIIDGYNPMLEMVMERMIQSQIE